jgi:UDP-perosamine 4-acetyltransferase
MKRNKGLIILGAGGHAKAVAEVAVDVGFEIRGFVPGQNGLNLAPQSLILPSSFESLDISAHFALGVGDNSRREQVLGDFTQIFPQASFPNLIHPSSVLAKSVDLEKGVVVHPMVVVGANVRLSAGVILNSGAIIEHDSSMGAFSSLAPGSRVAGGVRIGARASIGLGAGILPGVEIGTDAIIGAMALVTKSIAPGSVEIGIPSRPYTGQASKAVDSTPAVGPT